MADILTPDLAGYLRAAGALRFEWGRSDCCTWVCDWIVARRGVDPASQWRGRYRTARGALRHVSPRRGGFVAVVSAAMTASGLETTVAPQPGDVGIILSAQGASLAIRTATGWAGLSGRGIVVAPFDFVAAWKV